MTADLECKIDSTAKRFEPGGVGYLPALALAEATKLITETTPEEIATEIKMLSKNLREKLLNLPGIQLVTPFDQAGGITSIKITENTEKKFIPLCRHHKIALSKRGELVRFSLHAFNEEQEIDYVIDLLRKCSEA
jgi:selenocysteine lyase/cysteine desulfurase